MELINLAEALISNASKFLGCYEDPKKPNRSSCIDEIQKMFDPSRIDKGEAYCAKFVSNILNLTFPFFLKLPPTLGSASTVQLMNKAEKNKIPILTYPVIGSVFFYSRGLGKGHVGFVAKVNRDANGNIVGFTTIEGNASQKLTNGKTVEGIVQINRTLSSKNYLFIDYPSLSDLRIPSAGTVFNIVLITAATIGAYYTYKRFGQDIKKKLS